MPSFDCGGGSCGRFSCSSCTDEATQAEYWNLLQTVRNDAEAEKIMHGRLAEKRARATKSHADVVWLVGEVERLRAENERLRGALYTVMGACDAECAACGAYYVAKKALDDTEEKP